MLTTSEVARILRMTAWGLLDWRRRGVGPPFLKLSRSKLLYPRKGVESFLRDKVNDMSTMESINRDARQNLLAGLTIFTETFAATGLTANGANTVPWPVALPQIPIRVSLTPVGNGAVGAVASLDTARAHPIRVELSRAAS